MEREGFDVIAAEDGQAGLESYREHQADIGLIVSDIVMPEMDGLRMADALRRDGIQVPILFVSAYSSEFSARSGSLPSKSAFLAKPWRSDKLVEAVRTMINGTF